jgi:hypothetical protein
LKPLIEMVYEDQTSLWIIWKGVIVIFILELKGNWWDLLSAQSRQKEWKDNLELIVEPTHAKTFDDGWPKWLCQMEEWTKVKVCGEMEMLDKLSGYIPSLQRP